MLAGLRRYLGQAWAPLRIEVEYDRPRCWRELEEEFRAPVKFGADTNAIVSTLTYWTGLPWYGFP